MNRERGRPRHQDILTPREWAVLELLREDQTNTQIAERLNISFSTAKYHVAEILSKLGARDRHEAVRLAGLRKQPWLALPTLWTFTANAASAKAASAPSTTALAVATLAAVVLVLVLGFDVPFGSRGEPAATRSVSSVHEGGLDLLPESTPLSRSAGRAINYERTLLFTKTQPANVGGAAGILSTLRTVRTLSQLDAALTPAINVIVIDESAADEVLGSDLLYREMVNGRAIVELNLCLDEVHSNPGSPSKCERIADFAKKPEGFFGYRFMLSLEEVQSSISQGQNGWQTEAFSVFSEGNFEALLTYLDYDLEAENCREAILTGLVEVPCPE